MSPFAQGDLSEARLALVNKAFEKLDRDGSGVLTLSDLKGAAVALNTLFAPDSMVCSSNTGVYNASKHPEVVEGRKTEDQVLTEFLSTMEGLAGNGDGTVTKAEFTEYYTELSASIPTDTYFTAMMEVLARTVCGVCACVGSWTTCSAGVSSYNAVRLDDPIGQYTGG